MKEIIDLIKNEESLETLAEALKHYHPFDIASSFGDLEQEDRAKLYKILDSKELGEIFSYIEDASEYLEEISINHAASIITEMDNDDAADVLSQASDEMREEILSHLDDEQRADIIDLVQYEDNQAGSIMDKTFIAVASGITVNKAMKQVIKEAPEVSDIDTIFVTKDKKLLGVITLKELIIAKSPTTVDEIMDEKFHFVSPEADLEDTLKIIKDYDIYSLPVIENEELIGIITMDDALLAMVDESMDDYAKLSGLTSEESPDESVFQSLKKRIPWLAILLILDFFVSMVISTFENTIAQKYVLVFFQSVILGLAGNAGTQALAVSIRKISQGELDSKVRVGKHLFNEFKTGLSMGVILGIIALLAVTLFLFIKKEPAYFNVAIVVSVAIVSAMSLSSLFGSLIPLLFEKLHIDPAVASGPFITTINDILAVVIYFGIASIMIFMGFI